VRNVLPYGVSKAALWMITRYLAVELAPLVRVNALVPGLMTEDGSPRSSGQAALLDAAVPFGRVGHPSELTGAAVYLASPAASYTSGTVLFCNGARPW
jgi:NAD(P)-dependent dehydrogenase (short-subunit alcohol dehydrogenase family)